MIANSIKEFWFTQPIVIDEDNCILAGHGRYYASQKLWLEKVPCNILEWLTDAQKRKYRILDNKLNESDWDLANVKFELSQLEDFNFWELEFSVDDLFPEFTTPEFNPSEFWEVEDEPDDEDEEEKKSGFSVVVFAKDEAELELLKKDLDELGYRYK
jgi:ParB-like chromosome segregation protein Spo0J